MTARQRIARDLLLVAHAGAVAKLRHLGVTVPSSLDVLAEARRCGVVAAQPDVLAACAALDPPLPLADQPHDPPPPLLDRIRAALRPRGETP